MPDLLQNPAFQKFVYLLNQILKSMDYTIKISDTSPKAKSIINMLKELSKDYSFLTISEDMDEVQENILQELDARYEYMKDHPDEWKTWEEVKKNRMNS